MSRREVLVLALALGAPLGSATAAEPARTVGRVPRRVVLENDSVRVLEFVSTPPSEVCGAGRHWHPARVTVFLTSGRVRVRRPDGTEALFERKAGEALWSPAAEHEVENAGDSELRILNVEVKDKDWRPS
jgi:quercetin dioxygenase-like cupin family protein